MHEIIWLFLSKKTKIYLQTNETVYIEILNALLGWREQIPFLWELSNFDFF